LGSRIYTLLRGRVLDRRAETSGKSPHYQMLVDGGERFRVAVNTRSGSSHHRRSDLLYFADDDFRHPLTLRLADIDDGAQAIPSEPNGLALDYQRGGMFDRRHMRRIPASLPGPDNDLVDELDYWVEKAIENQAMRVFAYGTRWGPETHEPDQVFAFSPGNGIHDVHMNQGNRDDHAHDNGTWADGGLIFHDPRPNRWCAIFLAFQTQSWHTDDQGNALPVRQRAGERHSSRQEGQGAARITGAFVNPNERKRGGESVVLWNDGEAPLDVTGWQVHNRNRDAATLTGLIPPGRSRRFELPADMPLSINGGLIRLVDDTGDEIDGVCYTRHEARRKRGSLSF
jgi:uncharacterized protein YukJ